MTKDLRERLTTWYANAVWAGKSLEEIAKMPKSGLDDGEKHIDDLLALIQEEMEAVIGEDEPHEPLMRHNSKPDRKRRNGNSLRAEQRQRLKQLLSPQTNNEKEV